MANFGLIGRSLKHSFSKSYFEKKFEAPGLSDHAYSNFELERIDGLRSLISSVEDLKGLNVTIPYKESVIPFLDALSNEAREIGAVNCISVSGNQLTGYNTDVYGFSQSIKPFLDHNHQRALVLGTGGASKAVAFALKRTGVDVYFVTSAPTKKTDDTFFYSEVNEVIMNAFKLVVNTTPLGMHPDTNEAPPLPYHLFTPQHLAYDLIYNPAETLFLNQARQRGAICVNGLSMLQLQAEKSWEIWNSNQY